MFVGEKSAYEESRKKRLEENKKRMEELNLHKLSQSLHVPKPSTMKKVKTKLPKQPVDFSVVRRSSRVKDMPPRSYKEIPVEALAKPRRLALQRAEDLQSRLDQNLPSFVKPMLHSHVNGGFWLGLPVQFCDTHLPKRDETIRLVDENDGASEIKYLAQKTGLSGGWRGFATDHELVDGDALVFQLIEPTSLKVYIIRVNEQGEDGDDV